ncbi:MAG: cupin domain-containing protein [Pirellulales bacterium]|nr:cupin domain-containing protein [Pirellulales bacterium]
MADAKRYEVAELAEIPVATCPCGTARRAFINGDSPLSFHLTEISANAQLRYHQRHTACYCILSCDPDAKMQLDDEMVSIYSGLCILIPLGVRHRVVDKMHALIVSVPKFDPAEERFD